MTEFLISHWLDITTTILGLAYILFEYRASVWLWPVGFVMQALGIVLYYEKGLYADCGMEFYYICMTVYGFISWTRGHHSPTPDAGDDANGGKKELPVTHIPAKTAIRWTAIALIIWAAIYWLLITLTDSRVPLADSFTTAFSVVGIWALARKYLEQWFVWIVVDVVTSCLYFYKDIPFKASLYALYVVIAVAGYMKWRRMMKSQ